MRFEATNDEISPGQFWRALGERPMGAIIVTTLGEDGPEGFLGLSFAHVSAQPPTVLVSVGKSTAALGAIRHSRGFAANLLPSDSESIARAFGGELPKESRFYGVAHSTLVTASPILDIAFTVFDCLLLHELEEDGAVIFIARVVGIRCADAEGALVAYRGGYGRY